MYGGQEPSRNRFVVPARQATQSSGINSLESIPGLHKSLKIPSLMPKCLTASKLIKEAEKYISCESYFGFYVLFFLWVAFIFNKIQFLAQIANPRRPTKLLANMENDKAETVSGCLLSASVSGHVFYERVLYIVSYMNISFLYDSLNF